MAAFFLMTITDPYFFPAQTHTTAFISTDLLPDLKSCGFKIHTINIVLLKPKTRITGIWHGVKKEE